MSASSIRRQVAEVEKAKKVERRHALEARQKPEDDQQQHQQAEIRGVSAETGGSDSSVASESVKKEPTKKAAAKKKPAAKKASKKS